MNILILGINGDIGNSIFEKIYNENNYYFLTYSKLKPMHDKKNVSIFKINFQNNINFSRDFKKLSKFNFDLIINNVGDSNPYKTFERISPKDLNKSFLINYFTPFQIITFFIKKNLKINKPMNIINISSNTIKFFGSKKNFPYLISKMTLENSLLYLSKHYAKNKIRINIIRPGLIKSKKSTPLKGYSSLKFKKREKLVPLLKSGIPQDVSQLVKFLIQKESCYIVGQVISVAGGE